MKNFMMHCLIKKFLDIKSGEQILKTLPYEHKDIPKLKKLFFSCLNIYETLKLLIWNI